MIIISHPKDIERIKRLALNGQGLLQAAPFGRGSGAVLKCISHLGYVQIDTIAVVERAHHHVLHSRIPGYQPKWLQQLVERGQVFEYWSHAAAFLPMKDFRFSLPYKQAIKCGQVHWFKHPDRKLMKELLTRIQVEGPLRSRDVASHAKQKANTGWWDWKPAKKALEQLYMEGDVMVVAREGMQKTYDLTERVLPSDTNTVVPAAHEMAQHLLTQQLRCHQVVSLKGLTYLRRDAALRKAMKERVNDWVDAGKLQTVQWHDGSVFYIQSDALDARMPSAGRRLAFLSPFDNAVIQRDRLRSLFGFDYQIECYLPEAKRRYGYFSLPLLYRGDFIGRMDCKAHRERQELEIKSLHFETHGFNPNEVNQALFHALSSFKVFQGCDSVHGLR